MQKSDHIAVLVPTMPYQQLKIGKYIADGRKRKLFKGESITAHSDTTDDLYYFYIEKGQVSCRFTKFDGQPATLFYRNAGNAFSCEYGNIASLGGYRMRYVATQDTIAFGFTQRQLYEIGRDDPDIFYEFVMVCHMAFGQMGHRLACIGVSSTMKRLVFWLHKLAVVQGADSDGVYRIPVQITNQQLAELLGIHPTTCSRMMGQLKSDGVIEHTRNMLTVRDLAYLESYED